LVAQSVISPLNGSNDIAGMARPVLQRAQELWRELEARIQWCDERIAAHQKEDEQVQRAAELRGVGPITASAVVATVGDFKQFKNGAAGRKPSSRLPTRTRAFYGPS
jgi:transposase